MRGYYQKGEDIATHYYKCEFADGSSVHVHARHDAEALKDAETERGIRPVRAYRVDQAAADVPA